eukprot:gene21668-28685_t
MKGSQQSQQRNKEEAYISLLTAAFAPAAAPCKDASNSEAYAKFQCKWDEAVARGEDPSLRKVLFAAWGTDLVIAGMFKLLWSVCVVFGAFFFVRSLQFHVREHPDWGQDWQGWLLAVCFFVDGYVLGIALQRMSFGCMQVGVKSRAALLNAICRKSFAMSSITKKDASDCVSFVASDLQKVFEGIQEIHYLWTAPVEAMAILIILVCLIEEWALPGWVLVWLLDYRLKNSNVVNTQERNSFFQELLPAMKLVKYYGWEQFFEEAISDRSSSLQPMNECEQDLLHTYVPHPVSLQYPAFIFGGASQECAPWAFLKMETHGRATLSGPPGVDISKPCSLTLAVWTTALSLRCPSPEWTW